MYHNDDLGESTVLFLLENKIDIVDKHMRAGGVTHIALRGSSQGLQKFVNRHFTADESPVVYNLLYR